MVIQNRKKYEIGKKQTKKQHPEFFFFSNKDIADYIIKAAKRTWSNCLQ